MTRGSSERVKKERRVRVRGDHAHLLEFYFRLPWCCYCGVWHRCKWQNLSSAFLDEKSGRETNLLLWECVAPADTSHTPNPTPSPHLRKAAPPPHPPTTQTPRGAASGLISGLTGLAGAAGRRQADLCAPRWSSPISTACC